MKRTKPRRSVFLIAAELQTILQENGFSYVDDLKVVTSAFSCINLRNACFCAGISFDEYNRVYQYFYAKHFRPKVTTINDIWWPRLPNGEYDYEPRIFALLLCAEMLRRYLQVL